MNAAYQQFLESPFWAALREQKLQRNPKCEKCGSDICLEAHHILYRPNWFWTRLEDLKTLCYTCHRQIHHQPVRPSANYPNNGNTYKQSVKRRFFKPKRVPQGNNRSYVLIHQDGTRERISYQYRKEDLPKKKQRKLTKKQRRQLRRWKRKR